MSSVPHPAAISGAARGPRVSRARIAVRLVVMAHAAAALTMGLWIGLVRLGWVLPLPRSDLYMAHGPLMVAGLFGTLISLERAIAVGTVPAYIAPVASALATSCAIVGVPRGMAPALFVLSSVALALLMIRVSVRQRTLFDAVGALGAILFVVGNVRWAVGDPIFRVVPYWIAFLVLTIAAERLELSRLAPPSRWRGPSFVAAASLIAAAPFVSQVDLASGGRALALGLVAIAVWLVRFDIVRRTIRQKGLPRFVATTLLGGYAWLVIAGGLLVAARGVLVAGPMYDAVLHSVFVGFVFSMLFAHAPIVLPIITGARISSRSIPAWHVGLLHASLVLRIAGDVRADAVLRRIGGAMTVLAIATFLVVMSRVMSRGATRDARSASR